MSYNRAFAERGACVLINTPAKSKCPHLQQNAVLSLHTSVEILIEVFGIKLNF